MITGRLRGPMRVRLLFGCCSVFEVDVWVELGPG
jgi:hypothetical protein